MLKKTFYPTAGKLKKENPAWTEGSVQKRKPTKARTWKDPVTCAKFNKHYTDEIRALE